MRPNILVAGATGKTGLHFVRELIDHGQKSTVLVRDAPTPRLWFELHIRRAANVPTQISRPKKTDQHGRDSTSEPPLPDAINRLSTQLAIFESVAGENTSKAA